MSLKLPLAKVIAESYYLSQLENLRKIFPNVEEVHNGVVFALERNPLDGEEIEFGIRALKTYPVTPHAEHYVLYKYNDARHSVHLLSIAQTGLNL